MSLPLHERKRTRAQRTGQRPDSRKKGPGTERTAGGRARWIGRKAEEPRGREGARLFRADLQTRQDAAHEKRAPRGPRLNDMGRKRKGAPRRGSPAAPPRPSPPDAGRAPSTGQRRPALPRADPAVPSALGGLASGFGMGPGVPRPPWPLTGGRRSSSDDENASHALGEPLRVPWGPHSELNGPRIHHRPELHPPST